MTTEKLAKAYRLAGEPDATPESIRGHTFGGFVQDYFRAPKSVRRLGLSGYAVVAQRRKLAATALKIEQLAPATNSTQQPRNTEYPWEVGGNVLAPTDELFEDIGAQSLEVLRFLKLLRHAIADFEVGE